MGFVNRSQKIQVAEPSDRGSISIKTVATDTPPGGPKSVSIAAFQGVSISGTVDDFCSLLEKQLDHPVVNEIGLQGTFHFDLSSSVGVDKDFLTRVRDQLGLVISTEHWHLAVLAIHAR